MYHGTKLVEPPVGTKKTYDLVFNKRYLKDLKNVPSIDRRRIQKKIRSLQGEPRPHGCKKLESNGRQELYRIRCGNYRVAHTVKDTKLLILILQIGHRREVYRQMNLV